MIFSKFSPKPNHTVYIKIDTSLCQACWKCIDACRYEVLGKIVFFQHRHARVRQANRCKGCKKCVGVCENGAIYAKSISDMPQAVGTNID